MPKKVAEYPVPVVLKKILKDKISGQLIVKSDGFEKQLFFEKGQLVFARTNVIQERLGEILFKLGKIGRAQFWNIHKLIAGKKEKVGKVLVQSKILNQRDVFLALLFQAKTIATSTFAMDSGEWLFSNQIPEIPEDSHFAIELQEIIREGINKLKNISYFRNKFNYFAPQLFPLPQAIRNFLSKEEIRFYRQLGSYNNIPNDKIIPELNIPEDVYWRIIILFYLLSIVEFIEVKVETEMNQSIEEVIVLYEKLLGKKIDYFQLFGLKHDAGVDQVKEVYFNFAKKYHPDRIGGLPDPELKEKSNYVFSEINKAYDVLGNDDKRRAYLEKEYNISHNETKGNLTEKARILYRKAKTLYSHKKYWEAVALLDEAVRIQSDKASYFLLLGLCQLNITFMKRMAEKNLQKTIQLEPWNVEAHAALGLLYASENQIKRAEVFFRKVLSINPDHSLARKKIAEIQGADLKKKQRFSFFGKPKK